MEKLIPVPTMKDLLGDEFMEPLHISTKQLAHDIQVPESTIKNVLAGKQKIDADLSIRLGKYFGMSENFLSISKLILICVKIFLTKLKMRKNQSITILIRLKKNCTNKENAASH